MQVAQVEPSTQPVTVHRWPSEIPLFVTIVVVSILIWLGLIVGTFGLGLVYVILIGLFLFFAHASFIASIRGSSIRLGPDQFPDLYARVVEFASRAGLRETPVAYLMQADGGLNAFATKFFRGNFVVLYSDLLVACGDDHAARDMIIGHEIGHLRSNHLNWTLLTLPGRVIPFLGSAYSRACEFTCDRWGSALSGDPAGARRGLLVLAAGAEHYPKVNEAAFIRQQEDLDTGWMTLARWLGTYPPLSSRVQAIGPEFGTVHRAGKGALRAWGILFLIGSLPVALMALGMWVVISDIGRFDQRLESEFGTILGDPTLGGAGTAVPSDPSLGGAAPSQSAPATTFGSVEEMGTPTAVPAIADEEQAGYAQACFAGDMQACDDLYYATPVGSAEEAYGITCGGRVPENEYGCVDLVAPAQ